MRRVITDIANALHQYAADVERIADKQEPDVENKLLVVAREIEACKLKLDVLRHEVRE